MMPLHPFLSCRLRRRWALASFVFSILVLRGAVLPGKAARPQDVTPFAIAHGPYLQLPSDTSVTIVWHTNRPAVSHVEYGTTDALGVSAFSSEHGLIPNDRTNHAVRLTGLLPGRTYKYRVVSRAFDGYEKQHIVRFGDTVTSEAFAFTTLSSANASYRFAALSDIHENVKRFETLLGLVDWPRTPFVVFNGDMVNDFMNPGQPFSGFVDASVARFARTVPFVYVRGNHDVRGRYARRLSDDFPTRDGRAYFSFDHGPVHFIVLDSGEDKADGHEYYNGLVSFEPYRAEQARWLAKDLQSESARRARYRVVLSHIPPYGGESRQPAGGRVVDEGFAIQQVRAHWEKAANAGRVDLWLSGHTHRYAHVAPTTGANRYDLVIGAPDTVSLVDVSARQLLVTTTRETGETVGSVTVRGRR